MAILDPRTLDLIETLTAVNMDWLAFELVGAIQTGRTHPETHDMLALTRQKVRQEEQPKAIGEPVLISQEPSPIIGVEQIEWASEYVAERIETTLAYLMQSIKTLDVISRPTIKEHDAQSDISGELLVVLADVDAERKVRRTEVEAAITIMIQLRHSLEAWSTQARNEIQR